MNYYSVRPFGPNYEAIQSADIVAAIYNNSSHTYSGKKWFKTEDFLFKYKPPVAVIPQTVEQHRKVLDNFALISSLHN